MKFRLAICLLILAAFAPRAATSQPAAGFTGSVQIAQAIKARFPALLAKNDVIASLQTDNLLQLPAATVLAADYDNLPAPPDDGLVQDIQSITEPIDGASATPNLLWLPAAGFGGVFTVQGGDNCTTWKMFTLAGPKTRETQTPAFFDNPICALDGENSYVGFFGAQAVALLAQNLGLQDGRFGFRLFIDSWTGKAWDNGAMFTVSYDYSQSSRTPLQIVCLSADCAGIARAGLDAADRFNQAQTFAALTVATSKADMDDFLNYTNTHSTDCSNGVVPVDLADNQIPDPNGDVTGPVMGDFGDDAILFPSRLDGKFIVGCIGHAIYPPHTASENLLVEFFAATPDDLQPIDAMQFAPDHTKIHIISVLDNQ